MSNPESLAFAEFEREAVYRAIHTRRDVRRQFRPEPIPNEVLLRILGAAHHAPSVGYSQPWDFILIDSLEIRRSIKTLFERENERAAQNYVGQRGQLYRSLKLEGILDAPLNLCITCDRQRSGPHILGRNTVLDADLFSTCLAVQNLWLAARAEGLGVGWVSILEHQEIAELFSLPPQVVPLAYLCLGYVTEFLPDPDLEQAGWRHRLPLHQVIHRNGWSQSDLDRGESNPVTQEVPC